MKGQASLEAHVEEKEECEGVWRERSVGVCGGRGECEGV